MPSETLADIVAEMRGMGNYQQYSGDHARQLADRIEAAWRSERVEVEADALSAGGLVEAMRHKPSNAAAMREALVKCREIALQWEADEAAGVAGTTDKPESRSAAEAVIDMEFEINAALAAPPRNCDRYSHDEALSVWAAEKENGKNGCFDEWLYSPTTEQEGGAK